MRFRIVPHVLAALPLSVFALPLAVFALTRCGSGISDGFALPISVWVVSSDGNIHHSSDGGASWVQQRAGGASEQFNAVAFRDLKVGVAVGNDGFIVRTTDGGANWLNPGTPPGSGVTLYDVAWAPGSDVAIAVGSGGNWTRGTTNADEWTSYALVTGSILNHAYAVAVRGDSDYIVGGSPADSGNDIGHTTNGGSGWNAEPTGIPLVHAFSVGPEGEVWAAGAIGKIEFSADGANFSPQVTGTSIALYAIDFVSSNFGWAAGQNGVVIRTSDGGQNWSAAASPTSTAIVDIAFVSTSWGFALSGTGEVYRTTDGGESWRFMMDLGGGIYTSLAALPQ